MDGGEGKMMGEEEGATYKLIITRSVYITGREERGREGGGRGNLINTRSGND